MDGKRGTLVIPKLTETIEEVDDIQVNETQDFFL